MTIEIGYFFNDVCNSTLNSYIGSVFKNVLYASLLLTFLILIIIFFMYPCKKDIPYFVYIRMILYIFGVVLGILSIHNRITEINAEELYSSSINKEIYKTVKGGNNLVYEPKSHVKISPKYTETEFQDHYDENKPSLDDIDSEDILEHIISKDRQYEEKNQYTESKEINDEPKIKVVGASVDDMLSNLGV